MGMKKKSLGEVFIGLAVLTLGAGFFADALGAIEFGDVISKFWPVIIIVIGLLSLVSNPRIWWWPLGMAAFGTLLLLDRLDVLSVEVGKLIWPTILMLVGLSILLERGKRRAKEVDDDAVNTFVAFSGSDARSTSNSFKGGKMTALFGGAVLDLNDAKLTKDGANLDVFTFCGGIEVRVPEGWVVKVDGLPLFGGWENKTKQPANPDKAPVLRISGTCVFGGFGVRNGRPND
jgi:hypothetical protein